MTGLDFYVGKPWVLGATGPSAFDCWGLVLHCLRHRYGKPVPDLVAHLAITSEAQTPAIAEVALAIGEWRQRQEAHPGSVLALYDLHGALRHVGICVRPLSVLHTRRGLGARIEPLWLVLAGWEGHRFYDWVGEDA